MKSSGSVWFGYAVAVVVTFLVGMLAFTVFVLAKVFGGSSSPDEPAPSPQAVSTPSAGAARTAYAGVMEVHRVEASPNKVVLIVASPTGCAEKLRASAYAETTTAIAIRVTHRITVGCHLKAEPLLAGAKEPIGDRSLVINGVVWTPTADGGYVEALRTSG